MCACLSMFLMTLLQLLLASLLFITAVSSFRPTFARAKSLAVDVRLSYHDAATTPAEEIVKATTCDEILRVAKRLPLHGDPAMKAHETQIIHQQKRKKIATNAIKRLSKWLIGASSVQKLVQVTSSSEFETLCKCALSCLLDERTGRPFSPEKYSNADVELFSEALRALGCMDPPENVISIVRQSIDVMDVPCVNLLQDSSLTGSVTALERLGIVNEQLFEAERRMKLPFKLLPSLVDGKISLQDLMKEVKFRQDSFTTVQGKQVLERRRTSWMADHGVGGLAYSGKIMVLSFIRLHANSYSPSEYQTPKYVSFPRQMNVMFRFRKSSHHL